MGQHITLAVKLPTPFAAVCTAAPESVTAYNTGALERVLCTKLQHPAVLELLSR